MTRDLESYAAELRERNGLLEPFKHPTAKPSRTFFERAEREFLTALYRERVYGNLSLAGVAMVERCIGRSQKRLDVLTGRTVRKP